MASEWINAKKRLPKDETVVWVLLEHQVDHRITPMARRGFIEDGCWYLEQYSRARRCWKYPLNQQIEYWAPDSEEPPALPEKVYVI